MPIGCRSMKMLYAGPTPDQQTVNHGLSITIIEQMFLFRKRGSLEWGNHVHFGIDATGEIAGGQPLRHEGHHEDRMTGVVHPECAIRDGRTTGSTRSDSCMCLHRSIQVRPARTGHGGGIKT